MDNSPFSKLPRELRDEIWTLALAQDGHVALSLSQDHAEFWNSDKPLCILQLDYSTGDHTCNPLALTATCRQMRKEAGSMFYTKNRFLVKSELMDLKRGDSLNPNEARKFWGLLHNATDHCSKSLYNWARSLGHDNHSAVRYINLSLGAVTWKTYSEWNSDQSVNFLGMLLTEIVETFEHRKASKTTWNLSLTPENEMVELCLDDATPTEACSPLEHYEKLTSDIRDCRKIDNGGIKSFRAACKLVLQFEAEDVLEARAAANGEGRGIGPLLDLL